MYRISGNFHVGIFSRIGEIVVFCEYKFCALPTICHTHNRIFCITICHDHNCRKLARDIFTMELNSWLATRIFPDIRYDIPGIWLHLDLELIYMYRVELYSLFVIWSCFKAINIAKNTRGVKPIPILLTTYN